MLKKACNSSHNKARIDTVLEKYEDENAKLIFYELGIAGAHESIKKYLETQSFQPYEGLYNYPIQKYK